jgi:hypothetical protein
MLNRFLDSAEATDGLAAAVADGRTVVRVVVVDVGRVAVVEGFEEVVVLLVVVDDVGFLSALDPITLVLRSAVVLVGARLEGVPASDMRFAALEMPFFSSPELATLEDFSSAELLIETRDR